MKYFSWENFDNEFLKAIVYSPETNEDFRPLYETDEKDDLVCSMNMICDEPDFTFIKNYRNIIEDKLLCNYPDILKKVFSTLNIFGNDTKTKLKNLKQKPTTKSLMTTYITALVKIGGVDVIFSENTKFKYNISLNMRETPVEDIPLYDFQQDAVKALEKHFIKDDNQRGILVMPTGSGKSRTASYFLIRKMISQGYQILWIVHRHMLINQAAECFYKYAGLSKLENPDIKNYKISCVSSEHQSIKSVDKNDNIIIGSIQSICRNQKHLKRITNKKLMIVIDESHHTLARSYSDTIKYLLKYRPDAKILGLTATPVRNNYHNSAGLLKLFDNNIIYNISLSNLICKGILADPVFVNIDTNEDFEPVITEDEARRIKQRGELPESLLGKIAACTSRNSIIIDEYLNNAEKYGKTLIFALNIIHCRLLCEELKKRGVKCDCIYSGKSDNSYIIEQFKKGKTEDERIDVLVNVNIMTEGSDVPSIETVFLTRPTQSEGLLMQMIGRGMRGVQAGGTEKVNLVDFNDKWTVFNKWLNPKWLFSETYDANNTDNVQYDNKPASPQEKEEIYSWELCKEAYNILSAKATSYNSTITLPAGWYPLIDEDGYDYPLLVFEDQIKGYINLMKDKKEILSKDFVDVSDLIEKYFSGFCMRPSEREIALLIDNLKNFEEEPMVHAFVDRKKVDPYLIAKKAIDEKSDFLMLAEEAYKTYRLAEEIYGSWETYASKVFQAYIYNGKQPVYGCRVTELPDEEISFDRTRYYDLSKLVQEVKGEMFHGAYDGISSIRWTDKAYKGYYGCYYYRDNSIVINCVLNSKDVPREVVKFVIYHELLHRDYKYHDKVFREQEHKFKNYEECEYFLYGHMSKFEIEEW
ncbi:MAG: DEAD/DEAH box helicase [Clostridiales bacterium]|nr:DEAD/DEAH box helicase [Clostridiales bacterium]